MLVAISGCVDMRLPPIVKWSLGASLISVSSIYLDLVASAYPVAVFNVGRTSRSAFSIR